MPGTPSVEGKKTLRLSASPANSGTVSGGGSFDKGSRVSIHAVASGGESSETNPDGGDGNLGD